MQHHHGANRFPVDFGWNYMYHQHNGLLLLGAQMDNRLGTELFALRNLYSNGSLSWEYMCGSPPKSGLKKKCTPPCHYRQQDSSHQYNHQQHRLVHPERGLLWRWNSHLIESSDWRTIWQYGSEQRLVRLRPGRKLMWWLSFSWCYCCFLILLCSEQSKGNPLFIFLYFAWLCLCK